MVGYSYLLSVLVGFLLYSFLSQNLRASFLPLISYIPSSEYKDTEYCCSTLEPFIQKTSTGERMSQRSPGKVSESFLHSCRKFLFCSCLSSLISRITDDVIFNMPLENHFPFHLKSPFSRSWHESFLSLSPFYNCKSDVMVVPELLQLLKYLVWIIHPLLLMLFLFIYPISTNLPVNPASSRIQFACAQHHILKSRASS